MRSGTVALGACIGSLMLSPALAKVSAEQAKQLGGPVLTEFGAERAGNADGSIPAYTGGLTSAPPGISVTPQMDSSHLPDPYASDKILYSVNSTNFSQYQGELTAGTIATLKANPQFHVNVYQSHRSFAYPDWVIKNTLRNATTAELLGPVEGDGVKGAYGGIPFPIPQNGYELLWDNYLHWFVISYFMKASPGYFVDASGHVTLTNRTDVNISYPYYDPTKTKLQDNNQYLQERVNDLAPAEDDGTQDIILYPMDYGNSDQLTYFYTVGTRRVRLAPEFKYDTPIAQDGGALLFDEVDLFIGRPNKFNFKILGKKELIIPYNSSAFNAEGVTESQFLTPRMPDPDLLRWEKHRVWVLEATLKPGQRHVYARRTFYIDEDSWDIMATDAYDHSGSLYRVGFRFTWPAYNAPYPVQFGDNYMFANLDRGSYAFQNPLFGHRSFLRIQTAIDPENMFNPESMATSGVR